MNQHSHPVSPFYVHFLPCLAIHFVFPVLAVAHTLREKVPVRGLLTHVSPPSATHLQLWGQ
jgi:hypothetical protein